MYQTELSIEGRVSNGVSLLNEKVPNWLNRINLNVLDIYDHKNCILGQLYGSYIEGCIQLFVDYWKKSPEDWKKSIEDRSSNGLTGNYLTCQSLTIEWVNRITELREENSYECQIST